MPVNCVCSCIDVYQQYILFRSLHPQVFLDGSNKVLSCKPLIQGEDFFDDMDADEEECAEATGNEGATMDRSASFHTHFLTNCL